MPDAMNYPTPTSAELRARLEERTRSVQNHVAALQHELTTVSDVTVAGRPLPDLIREQPLVYAGLSLAGGLAVGLLSGFRARRRRRPLMDERSEVLRLYTSYLLDEAAARVARGSDPDEALEKTIRKRPPLIYYAPPEPPGQSAMRETLDVALKTALGFAVKVALDRLAQRYTNEDELFSAVKEVKENHDA